MAWVWFHRFGSPPYFYRLATRLAPWFAWPAALLCLAGLVGGLVLAPPDYQQGDGFRIIYVHAPAAWLSLMVYVVMAASANSPVGTRWIGLNLKGYGIHGTNAPRSIGRAASHGCIRLRNRDVERLYSMLRVGDLVSIRGERDDEIAQVFGGVQVATADVADETSGQ